MICVDLLSNTTMRIFILILLLPAFLYAQHIPVLEGLSGQELLTEIKNQYRPPTTLGYSIARDTLFRNILAVNGQLKCLYTDYSINLNPNSDPSDNAFSQGLNTEHIYPQSKGAENEPLRSNMYNLYPVRENVNSDRANDPFGEVPDNTTQWWYYLDIKQKTKPTSNIEKYSEAANNVFEPQEARKGDIARSIMYFYSIYTPEANAADPNFFQSMITDLCNWHYLDPVDSEEWNRNLLIASYQNDLANPFILDCTIPERSYCSSSGQICIPTSSTIPKIKTLGKILVSPSMYNSGQNTIKLNHDIAVTEIIVVNSVGNKIEDVLISNRIESIIQMNLLTPGNYFVFGKDINGYIIAKGSFQVF